MPRSAGPVLALALVVLGVAAPSLDPAPAGAITIGVAEQRPRFVTTTAFERTRIGHVRLFVGWNAIRVGWQRAELDALDDRGAGSAPDAARHDLQVA